MNGALSLFYPRFDQDPFCGVLYQLEIHKYYLSKAKVQIILFDLYQVSNLTTLLEKVTHTFRGLLLKYTVSLILELHNVPVFSLAQKNVHTLYRLYYSQGRFE